MADIFTDIRRQAGDTEKSVAWYRKKIRELGNRVTSRKLINQGVLRTRPSNGKLNMFFYNPKLKDILPYYDRFPLVLPLQSAPGGFLGLNGHYLPIPLRVRLLEIIDAKGVKASYSSLKRIKLIKPTIKHYLTNHLQSRFLRIDEEDFLIAALLPVQDFRKASSARVWTDSRRIAS